MTYGIIVAGGRGTRMNSSIPKQFMDIDGHPMLYYSMKAFEESRCDAMLVVCGQAEDVETIADGAGLKKYIGTIPGGAERYDSCYNGIKAIAGGFAMPDGERHFAQADDIVLIHDAARPCVTPELINRMIDAAEQYTAAVPVTRIKDTIVRPDSGSYDIIDRNELRAVQTPQAFRYGILRASYDALQTEADKSKITDDAMVVNHMLHIDIKLIEGEESNIKVTTTEDMSRVRRTI